MATNYTFGIVLIWEGNTRYKHYNESSFRSMSEAENAMNAKISEYRKTGRYKSVSGRALISH